MQLSLLWGKQIIAKKKLKDSETSSINGLLRARYNDSEWTAARFKSFITSALRTATRKWPPKYKALKDACIGRKVNKATNKMAYHYKCAHCRNLFVQKDVQVDHIAPVVDPRIGFEGWDIFIDRMFCEKDNLQVLCKTCHSVKTQLEKKERTKRG